MKVNTHKKKESEDGAQGLTDLENPDAFYAAKSTFA